MAPPRGGHEEQDRRTPKGTEVFVGGLPRLATESTLREIFSSCGEIIDVRIMKDQNGHSKGFGFVRFAKREYANTAKREKNGIELQGKRLDVDLSMDQDTVFFGNLCKEWTVEEFEELIHQTFKDVVSVDLALTSNRGSSNKRNINRGFAFVTFSSHGVLAKYYCLLFPFHFIWIKQSYANIKICASYLSLILSSSKRSTCAICLMHAEVIIYP